MKKALFLALFFLLTPHAKAAFTDSAHLVHTSQQYFSVNSVVFPTTDMTYEGWFYFASSGNWGLGGTIAGALHRSFYLDYDNITPGLNYHCYAGGEGDVTVSWTPSLSTWYHIAVTHTGTSVKFYVNGVQQGATQTVPANCLPALTDTFNIGIYSGAANTFDGDIQNVKFWSSARSAAQITSDECATLGATANLLGEWSLDNALTDNSGNGYTLTNNNGATFTTNLPNCTVAATFNPWFFWIF